MAITNLHDYLTSIADAIRNKKGTSAQINAQNFASEIESISGGTGGATLKTINGTPIPVFKSDLEQIVEKVYFNTNIEPQQVVDMINNIINTYFAVDNATNSASYIFRSNVDPYNDLYISLDGDSATIACDVDGEEIICFFYGAVEGMTLEETKQLFLEYYGFFGWNPVVANGLVFNTIISSGYGNEGANYSLSSIISITPFEINNIALNGEYNTEQLYIDKNTQSVDLMPFLNSNKIIGSILINQDLQPLYFGTFQWKTTDNLGYIFYCKNDDVYIDIGNDNYTYYIDTPIQFAIVCTSKVVSGSGIIVKDLGITTQYSSKMYGIIPTENGFKIEIQ